MTAPAIHVVILNTPERSIGEIVASVMHGLYDMDADALNLRERDMPIHVVAVASQARLEEIAGKAAFASDFITTLWTLEDDLPLGLIIGPHAGADYLTGSLADDLAKL